MGSMATLKIDLDEKGNGLIEIDGHDISPLVAGMAIDVNPGVDLSVRIQLIPVALAGEGEFEDVGLVDPETHIDA